MQKSNNSIKFANWIAEKDYFFSGICWLYLPDDFNENTQPTVIAQTTEELYQLWKKEKL